MAYKNNHHRNRHKNDQRPKFPNAENNLNTTSDDQNEINHTTSFTSNSETTDSPPQNSIEGNHPEHKKQSLDQNNNRSNNNMQDRPNNKTERNSDNNKNRDVKDTPKQVNHNQDKNTREQRKDGKNRNYPENQSNKNFNQSTRENRQGKQLRNTERNSSPIVSDSANFGTNYQVFDDSKFDIAPLPTERKLNTERAERTDRLPNITRVRSRNEKKDEKKKDSQSKRAEFKYNSQKETIAEWVAPEDRVYTRTPREPMITLGFTMGDVHGIGPELILEVLSDKRMLDICNIVIYGPANALKFYKQIYKYDDFQFHLTTPNDEYLPSQINLVDTSPYYDRIEIGQASERSGKAAFEALEGATQDLIDGKIDVLVTLPIDKFTIQNEAFDFPGHTEYLTNKFEDLESLMMMVYHDLRVAVSTSHIPLCQVSKNLTVDLIYDQLLLLHGSLQLDFNIEKPKIAVLGLNPHAGDGGLLGSEEIDVINVAIDKARSKNMLVSGAFAADGFFATAKYRKYDAVLAMYHDQGLIPFKTITQGNGVNYTAGLRYIRTSPDHGTAYDIAGQMLADTTSFREAIYLALDIYRTRNENLQLIQGAIGAVPLDDYIDKEESVL